MERTVGTVSAVITFVKTQPVYTGTSYAAWKKVPEPDGKRPETGRNKGGEAMDNVTD